MPDQASIRQRTLPAIIHGKGWYLTWPSTHKSAHLSVTGYLFKLLSRFPVVEPHTHWHTLTSFSILFFLSFFFFSVSRKSLVTRDSQSIMSETCIKFGEYSARVLIEGREIVHYASHVDVVKKEVSCWVPSEEGKVCESLFVIEILSIPGFLGLFSCMVRARLGLSICMYTTS